MCMCVCDQFMDILLLGWWWGHHQSSGSHQSGVCVAGGQNIVNFFHLVVEQNSSKDTAQNTNFSS